MFNVHYGITVLVYVIMPLSHMHCSVSVFLSVHLSSVLRLAFSSSMISCKFCTQVSLYRHNWFFVILRLGGQGLRSPSIKSSGTKCAGTICAVIQDWIAMHSLHFAAKYHLLTTYVCESQESRCHEVKILLSFQSMCDIGTLHAIFLSLDLFAVTQ